MRGQPAVWDALHVEYQTWWSGLGYGEQPIGPDVDITDHEAVAALIWQPIEVRFRLAAEYVRAKLLADPDAYADEASLDDPVWDGEALLTDMLESMRNPF